QSPPERLSPRPARRLRRGTVAAGGAGAAMAEADGVAATMAGTSTAADTFTAATGSAADTASSASAACSWDGRTGGVPRITTTTRRTTTAHPLTMIIRRRCT